jgi:hygromycin-B 7''-O-kinase
MAPDPPRIPGAPPVFETPEAYAACLDDGDFWAPYVAEILRRHDLPSEPPVIGRVGSFPTFLAGPYVVKLFGERFEGAISYQSERAVLRLLRDHPAIPAPTLLAEGSLFDAAPTGWHWPYLVMSRLAGSCWWDAALDRTAQEALARQLGAAIGDLHALPIPHDPFWQRDWIAEWGATCAERQRRWRALPTHLIDQIEAYLLIPHAERRLLHADLHDHHVFVEGDRLVGIIDWGDAIVADPYYELPALHLHTFNADRDLLAAFLDGYGWPPDADFARRAMSMALIYPFNVLDRVARTTSLAAIRTLDELADLVWGRP